MLFTIFFNCLTLISNENSSKAPDNAEQSKDNENANESKNLCAVCLENIEIYSVGKCDHLICYKCSTRKRVLFNYYECSICQQNLPEVIFTNEDRPYNELVSDNKIVFWNNPYSIGFKSLYEQEAFTKITTINCFKCDVTFDSFNLLKDHTRKQHQLFYCDICTQYLKIFPFERKCYSLEELDLHQRKGDEDIATCHGHPLCQFCDVRYFNKDEFFQHIKQKHALCNLCSSDGSYDFYENFDLLYGHLYSEHYYCIICHEKNMFQFSAIFVTTDELEDHLDKWHSGIRKPFLVRFKFGPHKNDSNEQKNIIDGINGVGTFHRKINKNLSKVFNINSDKEFSSFGESSRSCASDGFSNFFNPNMSTPAQEFDIPSVTNASYVSDGFSNDFNPNMSRPAKDFEITNETSSMNLFPILDSVAQNHGATSLNYSNVINTSYASDGFSNLFNPNMSTSAQGIVIHSVTSSINLFQVWNNVEQNNRATSLIYNSVMNISYASGGFSNLFNPNMSTSAQEVVIPSVNSSINLFPVRDNDEQNNGATSLNHNNVMNASYASDGFSSFFNRNMSTSAQEFDIPSVTEASYVSDEFSNFFNPNKSTPGQEFDITSVTPSMNLFPVWDNDEQNNGATSLNHNNVMNASYASDGFSSFFNRNMSTSAQEFDIPSVTEASYVSDEFSNFFNPNKSTPGQEFDITSVTPSMNLFPVWDNDEQNNGATSLNHNNVMNASYASDGFSSLFNRNMSTSAQEFDIPSVTEASYVSDEFSNFFNPNKSTPGQEFDITSVTPSMNLFPVWDNDEQNNGAISLNHNNVPAEAVNKSENFKQQSKKQKQRSRENNKNSNNSNHQNNTTPVTPLFTFAYNLTNHSKAKKKNRIKNYKLPSTSSLPSDKQVSSTKLLEITDNNFPALPGDTAISTNEQATQIWSKFRKIHQEANSKEEIASTSNQKNHDEYEKLNKKSNAISISKQKPDGRNKPSANSSALESKNKKSSVKNKQKTKRNNKSSSKCKKNN